MPGRACREKEIGFCTIIMIKKRPRVLIFADLCDIIYKTAILYWRTKEGSDGGK